MKNRKEPLNRYVCVWPWCDSFTTLILYVIPSYQFFFPVPCNSALSSLTGSGGFGIFHDNGFFSPVSQVTISVSFTPRNVHFFSLDWFFPFFLIFVIYHLFIHAAVSLKQGLACGPLFHCFGSILHGVFASSNCSQFLCTVLIPFASWIVLMKCAHAHQCTILWCCLAKHFFS